jgi:hypothetical protein
LSTKIQYECDCGCGAVKGENNHWFVVYIPNYGDPAFNVYPWHEQLARDIGYLVASGESCVHKLLSRWLEEKVA